MSRIGKKPIDIPNGVTVNLNNNLLTVKGPLGEELYTLMDGIKLEIQDNIINVQVDNPDNEKEKNAYHGLSRSLIYNMVYGVSKGFEKDLEIIGVGYRAVQQGSNVQLQLGFSHDVIFNPPQDITVEVVDGTKLKVKGKNKQQVGQVAANIRKLRPPEPYKGKGIRYKDEYVRKKAGKAGK